MHLSESDGKDAVEENCSDVMRGKFRHREVLGKEQHEVVDSKKHYHGYHDRF
jgi:hypothetical protein